MTRPFIFQYAVSAPPEHEVPYTYDPELQLNVMPDGTIAAKDAALMLRLGTTTSTAGSKTHFDD